MSELAQERRLVTSIPGPKSQALLARKAAAVADGVGVTLPVFVTRRMAAWWRTWTATPSSTSAPASP